MPTVTTEDRLDDHEARLQSLAAAVAQLSARLGLARGRLAAADRYFCAGVYGPAHVALREAQAILGEGEAADAAPRP